MRKIDLYREIWGVGITARAFLLTVKKSPLIIK
jgi:hypothetical protein